MRSPHDAIWIEAARALGISVERNGEAYVHFDGAVLHVAGDEHLDDDDTVGQLVLHELCHALVQGEARRRTPDWGLDNTSDGDEENELAAVRLQAHLLGQHGLRGALFPTTIVRAFFEALPRDAMAPMPAFARDGESASLARAAALRAARAPYRDPLRAALEAGAAIEGLPRHRKSGFVLLESPETCGTCAFRSDGGLCRKAPGRVFVRAEEQACVRFESGLDCQTCGACCRSAYDSVEVSRRDPVRVRQPQLVVDRGTHLQIRRDGDRCAALGGPEGGPFACAIYDDRPRTCRDFTAGGRHCLEARRRVGLSA